MFFPFRLTLPFCICVNNKEPYILLCMLKNIKGEGRKCKEVNISEELDLINTKISLT